MGLKQILLMVALFLGGCMGEKGAGFYGENVRPGDGPLGQCMGFQSPGANIVVKDAIAGRPVTDATVTVNAIGESSSNSWRAGYVDEDDGLSNSEEGAYFTIIELNELSYLINLHVSAEGYQDYSSEDMVFVVNTSCGAENNFAYTVDLCLIGAACP